MSHKNCNQDSGVVEYYTQSYLVEMARKVIGQIDLDPASCADANKKVSRMSWMYFLLHN